MNSLHLAQSVVIKADGFSKLTEFIQNYQTPIILLGNAIVAGVALFFTIPLIIKMMSQVKGKKWAEAGKEFAAIAGIVLIAGLGMYGVYKFAKIFVPDDVDDSNFQVMPAIEVNQSPTTDLNLKNVVDMTRVA